MEGDPKVDELMRTVRVAIERHVKDREAATEIYNRAYEAVMNSMDENAESILAHENDKAYWINREHGMQAEVTRLTTALQDANEDADRLAENILSKKNGDDEPQWVYYECQCGAIADEIRDLIHAANCPITLHRARVGGAS